MYCAVHSWFRRIGSLNIEHDKSELNDETEENIGNNSIVNPNYLKTCSLQMDPITCHLSNTRLKQQSLLNTFKKREKQEKNKLNFFPSPFYLLSNQFYWVIILSSIILRLPVPWDSMNESISKVNRLFLEEWNEGRCFTNKWAPIYHIRFRFHPKKKIK